MAWQYWMHTPSGETYAVEIDGDRVVDACGPLHYSEVTLRNRHDGNFNGDAETAEWVRANQDHFTVKEP